MEDLSPIDAFRLITAPDPTDRVMAASRLEAKARLRFGVAQALVQGRIGFHYQPVVRATNPRMPAFFEMLARLKLPFKSHVFEAYLHWGKSVSNDPAHRWLRGAMFEASVGK